MHVMSDLMAMGISAAVAVLMLTNVLKMPITVVLKQSVTTQMVRSFAPV